MHFGLLRRICSNAAWIALLAAAGGAPPTVDPTYSTSPVARAATDADFPPGRGEPAAKWIWSRTVADKQTVLARGSFTLAALPRSAALFIAADDRFEVFVNGHRVGATVATDGLEWSRACRFPVTNLLTVGRNVIAVRAYNVSGGAGLAVQLDGDDKQVMASDASWHVLDQATVPDRWEQVDFDEAAWTPATVEADFGSGPWSNKVAGWADGAQTGYMAHLALPLVAAQAVTDPARFAGLGSVTGKGDGPLTVTPAGSGPAPVLVVDFGREVAGRMQLWGTAGAPVSVTIGESREECDHDEPALDNNGPFTLALAGAEPVSTRYTAFRFAKLTFTGQTPTEITRVALDHKYYPVQYQGSFDCSDPLLTRIWYTGAYTAHLCMQETIWDAPKRDRGLWIGDMQVTGQTINNAFGDRFLMERSIEQVREEAQHGRGPTELPTEDVNGIPGYSASWFCTLADFHRHVGDRAFLKRLQPKIVSLLEYQRTQFDGRMRFTNPQRKWTFCDWSTGFVTDSPQTRATTHLYIIYGVREAVFLLRDLGDTADADKYAAWADQLTAAARSQFSKGATQTFSERIQENAMAVLAGAATADQAPRIYERVLRPGSPQWTPRGMGNTDDAEPISPYYGYFVLEAIARLDHGPDGIDLIRRRWGDMLRRGSTTFWEKCDPAWPDDMKWTLDRMNYISLCHGWSTGPTTYLTETVLGVRPTGPGFSTVDIRPQLGTLTWAEGSVPTPGGVIHVRVDRQGDHQSAVIDVPPNVSARIRLGDETMLADKAGTYRIASK